MTLGPIVTFTGTTPNIGTTVAAFAVAYRLAERSGQPVGFLCLNLKSPKIHRYLRVERPAVTLDRMRPELQARSLTPERLKQAAYRVPGLPNLHVLFGNLMRDQAEYYLPEEIELVLDSARSAFRLVVADVSAYWDNAATVAALRRADSRLLVTTAALTHFQEDGRRWIGQSSPLFGIPANAYETVVVRPSWRNGGFTMRDIQKETGLAMAGELRVTEPLLDCLDSGRLGDWLKDNEHGKKAMSAVSDRLMDRHGVRFGGPIVHRPWYRKLLAHRNGVST